MPRVKRLCDIHKDARAALVAELRKAFGWYMSLADVTQVIGASENTARKWLVGMNPTVVNGRKLWSANDVANKIIDATIL